MKRLLLVAVYVGMLILLVAGTGSVALYSEPSNCSKCHEMEANYETWKVSSHSSVSCDSCHYRNPSEAIVSLKGNAIGRIIDHYTKAEKHPEAFISKENCLRCHAEVKKTNKLSRSAHLVNPHAAHIDAGIHCSQCHEDLVHGDDVNANGKPKMETCIGCHKAREVSTRCSTCHYGADVHLAKIAKAGGYTMKPDEGCTVCHTGGESGSTNHEKAFANIGGYESVATCSKCHVDAMRQVESGVHSKLKTKIVNVPGAEGEGGMGTKAANPAMWANQYPRPDGTMKDTGCGQCHVGGSDIPTPKMVSEIDCLICHAEKYDFKKRKIVKKGETAKWVGHDTLEVAASVGKPKAEYCYRCHEDHMLDTRGTAFEPEHDVHAKAGMACQSCHITVDHKIARGKYVSDMASNDMPQVAVSCTGCHVDFEHEAKKIDAHGKKLACQTCHVGRLEGVVFQDRTKSVDADKDGLFEDKKVKGHDVAPAFYWYNGVTSEKNEPVGSRDDKASKIYPYKLITQVSAFDPVAKKPVSGAGMVFAKTGNFQLAVEKMAEIQKLPKAPKWVPKESVKIDAVNHSINKVGLECKECHAEKGIMDFKALGYSDDEAKKLKAPQTY